LVDAAGIEPPTPRLEAFFEVQESHGLLLAERVYGNLLRTFERLGGSSEEGVSRGPRTSRYDQSSGDLRLERP